MPDGNIQAEYKDNPTDEAFKTSPLNLAMYSMDGDNKIRVYLNVNQIMAVADTKKSAHVNRRGFAGFEADYSSYVG